MKAIVMHEYGGPDVLKYEETPIPEPNGEELLIRVHAAGVNPADRQIRAGLRGKLDQPFSLVLGLDVSGVVESLGDKVTGFQPGDEVYGMLPIGKMGGYAEFAVSRASAFAHKPRAINHIRAAAMSVVSLTSWQALFGAAELSSGQSILIHAASGGVGHIAVQFAKWCGAYVIGTASGRNEEFLREIGVDKFINYKSTIFEDVVKNVDVVLDLIPRELSAASDAYARDVLRRSWSVIRDGGTLLSICANPSSEAAEARNIRGKYILAKPSGKNLARIAELADERYVKPAIDTVLPLLEANQAHEISQSGRARGKIVLKVFDDDTK